MPHLFRFTTTVLFVTSVSLMLAAHCSAAEPAEKPSSKSLLEQAEADARESRFFGQQGFERRTSSRFERARDASSPFSGGRFAPSSLRDHEYGRIKKGPEDSHALRSLTNYYGRVQQRATARATAPSPSPTAFTGAGNLADAAERMQLASAMKAGGYEFEWRNHSLEELHGFAGRIAAAERLRERGFNVDWANYSGQELSQIAERAAFAEQLMLQGRRVDWSGFMRLAPPLSGYGPVPPPSAAMPPASSRIANPAAGSVGPPSRIPTGLSSPGGR